MIINWGKTMKALKQVVLGSVLTCAAPFLAADDHETFAGGIDPAEPMSVQIQLCTLNDGKSMRDYDAMSARYRKWAKKNDAEVALIRQYPFATHNMPDNPYPADFVEFLVTDFENSGSGWDKWMSTKEGQKLNAEWQDIATCSLKFAAMFTNWADVEAINTDDSRMVTWNWCTRREGVSHDDLNAMHARVVENNPDGLGNIGWFTMYPLIGGASASGEFAHVVVYPDMAGVMTRMDQFANGGWRDRMEYYKLADCTGEALMMEEVLSRPGD